MTATGETAPDELAGRLDEIRADIELAAGQPMTADPRRVVERHAPLLLAMLDAALKPHEPIQIYKSADDCGHECPPEPDWHASPDKAASDAWDAYQDEHTTGSGPDGGTGEGVRICLLSPDYMACPACSKLVYGTWGDEERFISASECTVRPAVIAAALLAEEVPAS